MSKQPQHIGNKLKDYRESANKQVEDTAEAIEMRARQLVEIEAGDKQPDEDVLAMLISHYKLDDKQAAELWELAGYKTIEIEDYDMDDMENNNKDKKELRINIPGDVKVLYSDMAQVTSNDNGLILNFMQSAPGNNAMVVSRVGVSKEHAQAIVDMLQRNVDKMN